jgi:FixJ family two-component response regulator
MQQKIIAVVDDEQGMLGAIKRLLTAHGFIIETFASAEAFIDSGVANRADCLILDIHLGAISGLDLRRRLTSVRSKLPTIFITASDDEAIDREAREAGCVACLRKPFTPKRLLAAVEEAIT